MSWNFALILFVLLVVTGIVWSLDRFSLRHKRASRVMQALELARPSWAGLPDHEKLTRQEQIQAEFGKMPWWVEYGVSFFPVILFVFVLRSFIVEPFRIPSGSMLPTLQSGDLILVNKFTYGLRLPVVDTKVIPSSVSLVCPAIKSLIWTRSSISTAKRFPERRMDSILSPIVWHIPHSS